LKRSKTILSSQLCNSIYFFNS